MWSNLADKFVNSLQPTRKDRSEAEEVKEVKKDLCTPCFAYISLSRTCRWLQQGTSKSDKRSFQLGGHLLPKIQEQGFCY